MKKIVLISGILLAMYACGNSAKTEEQEKKERDSSDAAQLEVNQHYVDSIEKADLAKEQNATDSTAGTAK